MGGVDLIDAAVATYRIKFKGKKWWWAHFINTLRVIMGAAWRIFCVIIQDEDQSLLYFLRSVVQSYLHIDKISAAPTSYYWKTKKKVEVRVTGQTLLRANDIVSFHHAKVKLEQYVRHVMWHCVSKMLILNYTTLLSRTVNTSEIV